MYHKLFHTQNHITAFNTRTIEQVLQQRVMANILRMSHKKVHYDKPTMEYIIDCQKFQNNFFRVFRNIGELGILEMNPFRGVPRDQESIRNSLSDGDLLMRTSKEMRSNEPVYPMNLSEGVHLIWRGAQKVRNKGTNADQLEQLSFNHLVGKDNDIGLIVERSEVRAQKMLSEKGPEDSGAKMMQKLIRRLGNIRESVKAIWEKIDSKMQPESGEENTQPYRQMSDEEENLSEANNVKRQEHLANVKSEETTELIAMSLFRSRLMVREREVLIRYLREEIARMDKTLLVESIMLIQPFDGDECMVWLEQSYPAFISFKSDMQKFIGRGKYNRQVARYKKAKEDMDMAGLDFKAKHLVMCHNCKAVKINKRSQGYCCPSIRVVPDPTIRPYAYQQLFLLSNYKALPEVFVMPGGADGEYSFKGYLHPYSVTYSSTCSRFICVNCIRKDKVKAYDLTGYEQEVGGFDVPLHTECQFCRSTCFCTRCNILDTTSRFIAIYDLLGGSFRKLQEEMIFNNPNCKHIRKYPVTFCNNQRDPKERAPQPVEELFRRKLQVVKKLLKRKRARSRPEKERNRNAGWVTEGKGRKVGKVYKRRTKAEIERDNAKEMGIIREDPKGDLDEEGNVKSLKPKKPNKRRQVSRLAEREAIYEAEDESESMDSMQVIPGLQRLYENIVSQK